MTMYTKILKVKVHWNKMELIIGSRYDITIGVISSDDTKKLR